MRYIQGLTGFALGVATMAVIAARGPKAIAPSRSNVTPKQLADTARFVAHNQGMIAGLVLPRDTLVLRNPFEGNSAELATGAKLYISYNCIDCHGADGGGAMAPAFVDGRWHFGGSPAQVYESIYQGRPDGMPSWGGTLDQHSIWRLVTYLRSLERGKNVTTENFAGQTVERTGH